MATPLATLEVLVVDGQSTGASPAHGHLLELGWARTTAGADPDALQTHARLVQLPDDAEIPRTVTRLTGIGPDEMSDAVAPAEVWAAWREAMEPDHPPLLIHYARFERPFLHALRPQAADDAPAEFNILCTHEIARRLLPQLPRRGLRALAGYYGHGVDELKRSAEHVRATAFVWHHLVAELRQHGIETLEQLEPWLAKPAPRPSAKRAYPMDRAKRLALPECPGVYRMRRSNGELLYVGKATSLRQRVNSYFTKHRKVPERTLEMLTQARDFDVTPTATVLEAALLESDEIKAHSPPYNVMLRGDGRSVWYGDAALESWSEHPSPRHHVGPVRSRGLLQAWASLTAPGDSIPAALQQRLWAGDTIDDDVWREGRALLATRWFDGRDSFDRKTLGRVGAQLWQQWREADAEPPADDEDPEPADAESEQPQWDPPSIADALERILGTGAHALRRAAWLLRLTECTVRLRRDATTVRVLHFRDGQLHEREDTTEDRPPPTPPRWATPASLRRHAFDLATFDRLCILTTELRRLMHADPSVELRLSPRDRLDAPRLRRALAWV
ncbi:MAG: GIY-YIG nuclease family protein [Myxococcota bacterium]